jgi:hypothetical protein
MPPPLGVNGLEQQGLCDTDKCATFLENTNLSKGSAYTTIRVRKPGHYRKGKKLTVILGIETINNGHTRANMRANTRAKTTCLTISFSPEVC